jgi:6-phosphogluconolactonase
MLIGSIQPWDNRRDLIIAGDLEEAIAFSAQHWVNTALRSILQRGRFAVALSGGSTPKAIYEQLAKHHPRSLDWSKVHLYWSDERAVPPDHADSNFHMAMEAGFKHLPIPADQIHRMKAETNPEYNAKEYAELIEKELAPHFFDLVMLGIGEDGHTASLFPHSELLGVSEKLVASAPIPEKNNWRMTLTFSCINQSSSIAIYALGASKQAIVPLVLNAAIRSSFPASAIGAVDHKALWILDHSSAHLLKK